MPTIGDEKAQLDDLVTFRFIATAFTEASATKIRKIRSMFEINKQFYEEIGYVYHLIRVNADRLHIKLPDISPDKEKILNVALTSNLRFYGALNTEIMKKFIKNTENSKAERLVIGSTGREYLRSTGYKKECNFLTFKNDSPNDHESNEFLKKVKDYYQIFVYYPKFISLVSQGVGIIDITQASFDIKKDINTAIYIIFEPEISQVLEFFQTQVRLILFQRVLLEADLARTAARLLTMSAAEEHTDELIRNQKRVIQKTISSVKNRQLLETFAGLSRWRLRR